MPSATTLTTRRPSRRQPVHRSTVPSSSSVRRKLLGSATSQNSFEATRYGSMDQARRILVRCQGMARWAGTPEDGSVIHLHGGLDRVGDFHTLAQDGVERAALHHVD